MPTGIEWADETLNLADNCWKTSPGCAFCWAERIVLRRGGPRFVRGEARLVLHPERLMEPVKWRRPRRVFVCSMSDLFHEEMPEDFVLQTFAVMAATPQHTYLLLTKRPEIMVRMLSRPGFADDVWRQSTAYGGRYLNSRALQPVLETPIPFRPTWPLPNVQLGVSVENQRFAEIRIPKLLSVEAALYWVCLEPLLEAVDLSAWLPTLGWVVVGGESLGPIYRALVQPCGCMQVRGRAVPTCLACDGTGYKPSLRGLRLVLALRDQCVGANVPFYFKQWGGSAKKGGTWGGNVLQGRAWEEFPVMEGR
jgi:protein gp37